MTDMAFNANEIARLIFDLPITVQEDLLVQVRALRAKYEFPAIIEDASEIRKPLMDYEAMESLTQKVIADESNLALHFTGFLQTIHDLAANDPHGELMDRMELLQGVISRQAATA